jgi:hypothetical protein
MAAFGESCRRRGHSLTARFDPEPTSTVHRTTSESAVPESTTLGSERLGKSICPILLFDHLVGAQQNRLRCRQTERLGGFGVQSHLEFDRKLNGKFRRLRAAQNAIHIGCRTGIARQEADRAFPRGVGDARGPPGRDR